MKTSVLEFVKHFGAIIVLGILGLLYAGGLDARVEGNTYSNYQQTQQLELLRVTSVQLLEKVSRIEGYIKALSEEKKK